MARFRLWLRDHVFNHFRSSQKDSSKRESTWRKSVVISAPIPLASTTIDRNNRYSEPLPGSLSVQDFTEPHPLRYSRRMSDDFEMPPSDVMLVDDDIAPQTPPPSTMPNTQVFFEEPEEITTRRPSGPTRNYSRRFSQRFSAYSTLSNGSDSSNTSGEREVPNLNLRRMSQMSAVSALGNSHLRERDELSDARLSRRFSHRMSGAFESYQTHTRSYAPLNII